MFYIIDTGDDPPVVSRPYRYDRVKQEILDYHVDKILKEEFRLIHGAGLTLNNEECKCGCEELKYLDLIINKEGIKTDETKVQAIVEMKPPRKSKEVSKFLGMSQWNLVLSSRDQLIEEQRIDPELGHIYRYPENPEDSSVNATICENWSRDFRLVEGLLFYAKNVTSLGEMRVYIPQNL
ncbi:hypothetical protein TNCV_1951901 [Trichonephila clavipes]|nr:hypothetical protein TNCV_1951901 [Trichonephila clavipes]